MKETILVVDDHPIILKGLQAVIYQNKPRARVLTACDIPTAQELLASEHIDIIIIDLELKDANGMQLIAHIRHQHVGTKIVVHTMHEEIWIIRQLLAEDVDAVVMKSDDPQELLTALHMIEQGKGYFSQQFYHIINTIAPDQQPLSRREVEVLGHISNGLSTNDIAQQLHISSNTVEFHRHNLMRKLSANNMAQLIKKAIQMGLNFV